MADQRAVPDRRLVFSPVDEQMQFQAGPLEHDEPTWTGDPERDRKLKNLHRGLQQGFSPGPRRPFGWPMVDEQDADWLEQAYGGRFRGSA